MAYGPDQILEGLGNSDYERYIRTPELLSLQKSPEQWLHRDELLFTVTHQTSELWLKLAVSEAYQIANFLAEDNFRMAMRLVPRILMCIEFADEGMAMLDQMTPWDYQQVRRALGHGSGFDSPGFTFHRQFQLLGSPRTRRWRRSLQMPPNRPTYISFIAGCWIGVMWPAIRRSPKLQLVRLTGSHFHQVALSLMQE